MTLANLQRSISGIKKEIRQREIQLYQLAKWYRLPMECRTTATFTMRYFYVEGPRIMREKNVLLSIRAELEKIIERRLEETPL
jgi:hypothetical protein